MALDLMLDPLIGRAATQPEGDSYKPEQISARREEKFSAVYELLKESVWVNPWHYSTTSLNVYTRLSRLGEKAILTPPELELFFQYLYASDEKRFPDGGLTSQFLSAIIQHSFAAGHNGFRLGQESLEWMTAGENLRGKPGRHIKLIAPSDCGDDCGFRSRYLDMEILGSAKFRLGYASRNSRFHVHGNIGDFIAYGSEYCEYLCDGDIGISKIGIGSYLTSVKNCVFKTHNPDTYKNLVDEEYWESASRNNLVMLLDPDGKPLERKVINP